MSKPTLDDMWRVALDDLQHDEVLVDARPKCRKRIEDRIAVRRAMCELIIWAETWKKAKAA